ncbi:MAG: hypothetical protein ACLP4W_17125 [Mycobacterium sp.]|uniref:hypothetical protein n=1 Tax=Mycobacterium sp. TaxID=1785 RepID=UPI003F974293
MPTEIIDCQLRQTTPVAFGGAALKFKTEGPHLARHRRACEIQIIAVSTARRRDFRDRLVTNHQISPSSLRMWYASLLPWFVAGWWFWSLTPASVETR